MKKTIRNKAGNIIRLGIGDVTRPLTKSAIEGLHKAVDEQAVSETFKGIRTGAGICFRPGSSGGLL